MDATAPVRDASLVERVVLLGLVRRAVEGRTPARVDEVRSACNDRLDEVTGRLSEADVCRALNELATTELVDERGPNVRSPAGKGRPTYELRCDVDATLTAVGADEYLTSLVADVDAMRA
ncbi:hypothetical protein [Halovivax sp.]|uniref:hypothetical protein n=1 Tax=Halovivax sp. TaxID=1935978 RepID=UPI0025B83F45|nr:hypothetical protein [Halovivax sp.]